MMEESFEEDCTIYIEELKSDDPNLKMNAVTKVCSIANIIGPARVCNELVPYLIEIIEEQDNEDEFLIRLAQEILAVREYVGGVEKHHVLISPLEILSSMEEPLIREKAVGCLI
jgi:serine/threonine-protein phosphatase 2A regulatory subunit A